MQYQVQRPRSVRARNVIIGTVNTLFGVLAVALVILFVR